MVDRKSTPAGEEIIVESARAIVKESDVRLGIQDAGTWRETLLSHEDARSLAHAILRLTDPEVEGLLISRSKSHPR